MGSRRRAFTLVELLVVVAIIGVLVSILLPIVTRVRGHAVNVVCKSNLRQIGNGILMYSNNHRGRLPDAVTLGGSAYRRLVGEADGGGLPEVFGWSALLDQLGYLPADRATGGAWVCPAQKETLFAYKNTYVAWTLPRRAFQNKQQSPLLGLVTENTIFEPWPTGVPAPVHLRSGRPDDSVNPANLLSAGEGPDALYGPHHYRLMVREFAQPESVSGIPDGTVFAANGYSHVLLGDLSLGTFQHFKMVYGKTSKGDDFSAGLGPVRVD